VAVNCGSLPDSLLEGELFGHERGAFTDAREAQPGLIAQAGKGTLFLDEVDSLSARAQACLLRVVQERRYRPLGSATEQAADVRLVTANNASLEQRAQQGAFRADLYYRLAVFTVHLPPLRQRREDVLPLAEHFLAKHAPAGSAVPRLTAAARAALLAHDWAGNVRELENAILRAVHFCGGEIEVEHLGLPAVPTPEAGAEPPSGLPSYRVAKQRVVEEFERGYLTSLMTVFRGNVREAAGASGKDRSDLGKLLRKYHIDIDPRSFRGCLPTSPG
jgi:DNA-binding NtrC family response regulator